MEVTVRIEDGADISEQTLRMSVMGALRQLGAEPEVEKSQHDCAWEWL